MHSLWASVTRDSSSGRYTAHIREAPNRLTRGEVPTQALEALVTAIRTIAGVKENAEIDLTIRVHPAIEAWMLWVPGMALGHQRRGYTLEEARAAVGPGWAPLAEAAHRRLTDAGCTIIQVKEKFAGLCVYFYWPSEPRPAGGQLRSERTLHRYVAWLERVSLRTCEACGAPGEECENFTYRRTLCASCTWRWKEGARGWSEIRGEWPPPHDGDLEA